MRFLFAIAALFCFAAAHHDANQRVVPQLFEANQEYLYHYRTVVASGLPRQSNQVSGLEKKGLLNIQVHEHDDKATVLALSFLGMSKASFDKEIEDLTYPIENVYHKEVDEFHYFQGPVYVRIEDNQVQSIKAPKNMSETILNMYRGVASVLSVANPEHKSAPFHKKQQEARLDAGEPVVYRLFEDDIMGNCETIYEVLSDSNDEHVLNITKSKNYRRCIGEQAEFVHSEHDSQGCPRVCLSHKPEQVDHELEPEMFDFQNQYDEGCPEGFHPEKDLAEDFMTVQYNISTRHQYAIIEEIQAIDKKIMPLRKQKIVTQTILDLKLYESKPIGQKLQIQGPAKKYENLTYQFPEEHYEGSDKKLDVEYFSVFGSLNRAEIKKQIIAMVQNLADVIVSDNIELKGRTGDKIVQLTMAFAALPESDLKELVNTVITPYEQVHKVSDKEYTVRKVFLDALSLAGSDDAAEVLIKLIKEGKMTKIESLHALEAMQSSLIEPGTDVMDRFLDLCVSPKFEQGSRSLHSSACITLAEIVKDNCEEHDHTRHLEKQKQQRNKNQQKKQQIRKQETSSSSSSESDEANEQDECLAQDYKKYVRAVAQQLQKSTEFHHQAIYIQTLGRFSHPDALKTLVAYVQGEEHVVSQIQKSQKKTHEDVYEAVQYLRQLTIYALHYTVEEHAPAVQPIVQAIYFDETEDYEIRNAALTVLLATSPPEPILARLVVELATEEDSHVASFGYSALRSLANSTLPCMQQTARRVKNVIEALPKETYGAQYSRYGLYTHYNHGANFGFKAQFDVTHSNVSAIPRAFYGGATYSKGPYVSNLFDFSVITKGLENLDEFVFQRGGPASVLSKALQRVRRAFKSQQSGSSEDSISNLLEQLEKNFNFNTEENYEEPKAAIAASLLGNDFYLPIDKEYVVKVALKAARHIQELWTKQVDSRYVRILMPHSYIKISPAINGFPIVMSNRHPIVVSISIKDFKARFVPQTDSFVPKVAAISAYIQPSIYYTAITSALTITPFTQTAYGVRVVEQTKATLPIDVAAQYSNEKKQWGFTFRPRFTHVFYHKTKALTFKTQALLIREPEQPVIDHFTLIKTQDVPFEYNRQFGKKFLGTGFEITGYSFDELFDVNFFRHPKASQKGPFASFIEILANPWVVNREWIVRSQRSEQQPTNEYKFTFRWGHNLNEHAVQDKENTSSSSSSSEEEIIEEKYPEDLQQPNYEQQYQEATQRKPLQRNLYQALERIAQQTEQYWSVVDKQLKQVIKKETTKVGILEFVFNVKTNQEPIYIVGHFIGAKTLDGQAKFTEFKFDAIKRPFELLIHTAHAKTAAPTPFEVEIPNAQQQRSIFGLIMELQTRNISKQKYSFKIEAKKSREQLEGLKTHEGKLYKPWYYKHCEQHKQQSQDIISDACELTRLHKAALHHVNFEIRFPKETPEFFKNVTHQFREHLKVRFFRNLYADYTTQTANDKIEGELIISDRYPYMRQANLTIRTPDNEELNFRHLYWPKAIRPTTMWTIRQQIRSVMRHERPAPECIISKNYLRTFDNVTISLKEMKKQHEYVAVRHNVDEPDFIIVVDPSEQGEHREVKVLLANTTLLVLTPASQKNQAVYTVQVNSTQLPVQRQKAQVVQYDDNERNLVQLYVTEHENAQDVLYVKIQDQGVLIAYDGQNIKIRVQRNIYKGQLLGLCGDMNQQHLEEFTSPEGCVFEEEYDFINSYAFEGQPQGPHGEYTCPEGEHPRGATHEQKNRPQQHQRKQKESSSSSEEYKESECMTKQHKMVEHKDKICFSQEKIYMCKKGCRKVESRNQDVAFVCIPKKHPSAQKIQKEIQSQKPISSIPAKVKTSFYRQVEEAKLCEQ